MPERFGSLTLADFKDSWQFALPLRRKIVTVTSAQILALNATPQTIVPAPGTGNTLIFFAAKMRHLAGTAYGGIAAGEDIQFKYTSGAGAAASEVQEITGWLDQTSSATKWIQRLPAVAGTLNVYSTNALLCIQILSGEITTGTGTLAVELRYAIEPDEVR